MREYIFWQAASDGCLLAGLFILLCLRDLAERHRPLFRLAGIGRLPGSEAWVLLLISGWACNIVVYCLGALTVPCWMHLVGPVISGAGCVLGFARLIQARRTAAMIRQRLGQERRVERWDLEEF